MGVVREIPDLVNAEQGWTGKDAESPLERARRLLGREIEDEIRGGDEPCRVAGEDGLMEEILRDHRLPEALSGHEDRVLALGDEVERQDAFHAGAMDLLGPGPLKIGHGLEATDAGLF